jgi:hypothetical protein
MPSTVKECGKYFGQSIKGLLDPNPMLVLRPKLRHGQSHDNTMGMLRGMTGGENQAKANRGPTE